MQDPSAFSHITDNSLVYAIHCYADVYKSVSEAPPPVMLVATDVDNFGKSDLYDHHSGRVFETRY